MLDRLVPLSLLGVCLSAATPSFAAEATYTPEQADLGERVANRYCVKCHDNSYFEGALYDAVRGQRVEYLLDPIRMTTTRPSGLSEATAQCGASGLDYVAERRVARH